MNMVEKWDKREEDYYLARNIFRRMHDEVSSLYSISDSNNHSGLETSTLEGDEKTFSFYTTAKSLYFPFSCLMKVTYKFIISDEGKGFTYKRGKTFGKFLIGRK